VKERPSARWGSLVWVEYSHRAVFQAFLSPARANVKEVAAQAAEIAHRNVVDSEVQRMFFRDPDLGADEF
jgi:curli production assembly/transport component CsgE